MDQDGRVNEVTWQGVGAVSKLKCLKMPISIIPGPIGDAIVLTKKNRIDVFYHEVNAFQQLRFMKLLIPRITDVTTHKDIRAFANRVLEKWFRLPFSSQPRIVSCKIMPVTNSMGVVQRHGLINVTPDDAALRIIRKLNGEYLKGKRVGVKRYHGTPEEQSINDAT
jgi:hypothetical protein